jgi:hypothetical protein
MRGDGGAKPQIVARVAFTDGVTRDVYAEPGGRQFVVDEVTGKPVFGEWVAPADEPLEVGAAP